MRTTLERLREALRPDYEIQSELGRGGMGMVFLARDVALQRPVAIKIIRPDLATAHAAERFVREARLLASLTHPNVVPVHRAAEVGGFPYYVMDLVEGETLAERLRSGPLPRPDALKLGRDVLDALEAVHALGIIHRDLKPDNIFLRDGRAVIADFGIALDTRSTAPKDAAIAGTPAYMPPEQAFGWEVTPQTDLYAAGMVLFEALTGRPWRARLPDERADWSGVPRALVPVLRRGLAWNPPDRWPDAAAFRRRWWRTRTRPYRRRTLLLTVGGIVVGGVAARAFLVPRPPTLDLAIAPFTADSGLAQLAANLRDLVGLHLQQSTTEPLVSLVPGPRIAAWWSRLLGDPGRIDGRAVRRVGARFVLTGGILAGVRETTITLDAVERDGRRAHLASVRVSDYASTSHLLGLYVVRHVRPDEEDRYVGSAALADRSDAALNLYVQGLRAFNRNAFRTATRHFAEALAVDSGFALAAWWLSNAWRWTVTGTPNPDVDLAAILATHGDALPELDRLLMDAQLTPVLDQRLARYAQAVERYPGSGYAAFLYAAESQDRGPYVGVSLEAIEERLAEAAGKDSMFGPSLGHLVWAEIRLGRRAEAERSHARFAELSADPEELGLNQAALLAFAIQERFVPERADSVRAALFGDPGLASDLARAMRLGSMLGLHVTQGAIAEALLADPRLQPQQRADLHEARGLAQWAQGRPTAALAQFDSAAWLGGTARWQLEAAEWRVLPATLGLPSLPAAERGRGLRTLRQLTGEAIVGVRAAWALGMDAVTDGRLGEAAAWRDTVRAAEPDTAARRLGCLLEAYLHAAAGHLARADSLAASLVPYDSAGRGGDPFARALLHVGRARWLDRLGRPEAADSSRRFYEHFEWTGDGYPSGPAQASEVDWALGPWLDWVRADAPSRCRRLANVVALWSGAEPGYREAHGEAVQARGRRCRP